jgi:hypothetical protein
MLRYRWVLVVVLALPGVASAQIRTTSRANEALPREDREFARPPMPEAKELEKNTPVAVLLDKKKKLSLTDSQVVLLTQLRRTLADSNAVTYAAWDSIRTVLLIAGKSPTADPQEMQSARRVMTRTLQTLQVRNDWARAEAVKALAEEQQPKAKEFWDDQAKDDEKWMNPRGGSRGGKRPQGS